MENKKNKIFTTIFVIFTLTLGFALRAQETLYNNFLFLLDQGRDMMAVKSIAYGHHLTLIGPNTSLQGVFQGPLWYYLLVIPTTLLNGNPWGSVLLMLIISMSVLLIIYFFTKALLGNNIAIISLFLFALSPEAIAAATYAWNPHPMWLLVPLYIFSFYLITKNEKFHLAVWTLIGFMFHFQTAFAVSILLATIIYLLIFNKRSLFTKHFLVGIFFLIVFVSPQILFDLRHNFLMSRSILNLFMGGKQGLSVTGESHGYVSLITQHVDAFYINFRSSFMSDGYLRYLPNILIVLIFFLIMFGRKTKLFSKQENNFLLTMVRLFLIIVALSFIYPFPIRYWFLTGFQSFYLMPLGIIFSKFLNNRLGKAILIVFFIIFIFYSAKRINKLYIQPADYGGVSKIRGKIDAIDYIYKDAKGKSFGLLVFTPPVNTDAYDYLVWWYGSRKYHYLPYQTKKDIFYLLMEPDYSKPWSYRGWLETVIKTGSVVWTEELQSDIIIQKRIEGGKNAG